MYNILKTLNIKIKMVSDIFHNVGVMIDPKSKQKIQLLFSWRRTLGWGRGEGGGGRGGKCTILGHFLAFSRFPAKY